ncbi:MAG: ABC transporter permease [Chloroflexi bacterium]|nr:ABC transporter permease [Chloroflexota bacterium]
MTTELIVIDNRARFDLRDFLSFWTYRELLVALTTREVRARYRQSLLGIGWAIAQPLTLMVAFNVVFGRFARMGSEDLPYPVFSYTALVPWTFTANALTSATIGLVSQRSIVTKTYFPREIIVMSQVGARFVDFIAAALVLAGLLAWYAVGPTAWLLLTPVVLIVQVVFTMAISLVTSALQVRFRDLAPVVGLVLQLWLYATPVAYPLSQVPEDWRLLYGINPMVGLVDAYRSVIAHGRAPDWQAFGLAAVFSLIAYGVAFAYFKRAERGFADVI